MVVAGNGQRGRHAARQARVDVREGHDLGLAIVPAPAGEHAEVVGKRLLEVEDIAVLDAALARLADVEIEPRIVERRAIAARLRVVDPGDAAQLAGVTEQRVAPFEIDDEGLPKLIGDAFVRQQVSYVEQVAGMLAVARPSMPEASMTLMPIAGAPGTTMVPNGMMLTTANSNAAMATISSGMPTAMCS